MRPWLFHRKSKNWILREPRIPFQLLVRLYKSFFISITQTKFKPLIGCIWWSYLIWPMHHGFIPNFESVNHRCIINQHCVFVSRRPCVGINIFNLGKEFLMWWLLINIGLLTSFGLHLNFYSACIAFSSGW